MVLLVIKLLIELQKSQEVHSRIIQKRLQMNMIMKYRIKLDNFLDVLGKVRTVYCVVPPSTQKMFFLMDLSVNVTKLWGRSKEILRKNLFVHLVSLC